MGSANKSSWSIIFSHIFSAVSLPRRGYFDQRIADLALEGLDFIEGRKHFWALQAQGATKKQNKWNIEFLTIYYLTSENGHALLRIEIYKNFHNDYDLVACMQRANLIAENTYLLPT